MLCSMYKLPCLRSVKFTLDQGKVREFFFITMYGNHGQIHYYSSSVLCFTNVKSEKKRLLFRVKDTDLNKL